jgi:eukaryotic-like serine/threonine-protein kinase
VNTGGSQLATELYDYPGADPARAGRVINDRYEVRGVVGRGGVADVVRAYDRLLNRDVAVKLFRAGSLLGGDLERIEAESRILASLSHPHLVTVFDAGVASHTDGWSDPFLVLEHVDGPTLAEVIAAGPVDLEHAVQLAEQLAGALACMHDRGIVHRDVKPSNILLAPALAADGTWHAKLTDFGIARVLDSPPLTQQGLTVGTPNYLSPEQVRGQPAGPASDVFALGLVLLEVMTGERVYDGAGPEVAFARLHRAPTVPTNVPAPWADLLRAMTAADPVGRPSATEVAGRATVMLAQSPLRPITPRRGAPGPVTTVPIMSAAGGHRRLPSTRTRRLVAAGVALLAAGGVVIGVRASSASSGSGASPAAPPPAVTTAAPRPTPRVTTAPSTRPSQDPTGVAQPAPPRSTVQPAGSVRAASTADPTPTGQASDRFKPVKSNGHGRGKKASKSPDG